MEYSLLPGNAEVAAAQWSAPPRFETPKGDPERSTCEVPRFLYDASFVARFDHENLQICCANPPVHGVLCTENILHIPTSDISHFFQPAVKSVRRICRHSIGECVVPASSNRNGSWFFAGELADPNPLITVFLP